MELAFFFFTNTHHIIIFASETFNSSSKENPFYYDVPNNIYIDNTHFTPLSFLLSFFEKYLFFYIIQNKAHINIQ